MSDRTHVPTELREAAYLRCCSVGRAVICCLDRQREVSRELTQLRFTLSTHPAQCDQERSNRDDPQPWRGARQLREGQLTTITHGSSEERQLCIEEDVGR